MEKIYIVTVGSLKEPWAVAAAKEYTQRIARRSSIQLVEISDSKQTVTAKRIAEESNKILEYIKQKSWFTILCDEHGQGKTSKALSDVFAHHRQFGTPLCFIIGGPYGVHNDVKQAVNTCIKLSDMTLPHELCRIVLLEQIYRAGEILADTGYHHE